MVVMMMVTMIMMMMMIMTMVLYASGPEILSHLIPYSSSISHG